MSITYISHSTRKNSEQPVSVLVKLVCDCSSSNIAPLTLLN